MNRTILFEHSAVKEVLVYLETHYNYKHGTPFYINKERYAIVKGKDNLPSIAITFKKEWFLKYGEWAIKNNWRNQEGKLELGIGDTVNCLDLRKMIAEGVKQLYIMHVSGTIYMINMYDLLTNSYRWTNKEGKEVRSFSIHNLVRVNKNE